MSGKIKAENTENCGDKEQNEKDKNENDKHDPFDVGKNNNDDNKDEVDHEDDVDNKDVVDHEDDIENKDNVIDNKDNVDNKDEVDNKDTVNDHQDNADNKNDVDTNNALCDIAKQYLDQSNNEIIVIDETEVVEQGEDGEEEEEEVKSQHDGDNENNHGSDIEYDEEFMKIFLSKIKLDDNTEEFLFSSGLRYSRLTVDGIRYSKSFFPINCHLCKCSTIKGKYSIQMHIESIEHQELLNAEPPNAKNYRKPLIQPYGIKNILTPIKIYPGEIIKRITPEYYDRVLPIKECKFRPNPSKKLIAELKNDPIHDYNQKSPVIGLCYGFKMKVNARTLLYYCTLCRTNLYGEPYQHFVGAGHQADYIPPSTTIRDLRLSSSS